MNNIEIHVEITNNCILDCQHCSSWANKNISMLDLRKVLNLIHLLKDEYKLRLVLTGGEPLLRKELVEFLVELNLECKDIEVGLFTTGLILENGMIKPISDKYIRKLKEFGLKFVFISVYSNKEEVHDSITRVRGSFEMTMMSIKKMINENVKTNINLVILKDNIFELEEIVKYLQGLNVNEIRLLKLVKHGVAESNWSQIGVSHNEQTEAVKKILLNNHSNISIGGFIELGACQYFSGEKICLAGKNKLYIDNNGCIYPCGAMKGREDSIIGKLEDEFNIYDINHIKTCNLL